MDTPRLELEPVLISALNHYVFCRRRCGLLFIEGMWNDNEHTVLGSLLHDHTDEPGYETDGSVTIMRALPLFSLRYGLVGMADIVEMRAGNPTPVEYKKGKKRRFENDEIQLCAQAFCLEEMLSVEIMEGFVYHAASKRRRKVVFDGKLRKETEDTIEAVRKLLREAAVPRAELKPRCSGCSLRRICLPELTMSSVSKQHASYSRNIWSQK